MIAWLLLALLVDVRPLTLAEVCGTRWGLDHRFVSTAMRKAVFARDGVPWRDRARYRVDHRVPRELSGADVLENLWVQPISEAHRKDLDENRLHREVCAGRLTLREAQEQMRRWRP